MMLIAVIYVAGANSFNIFKQELDNENNELDFEYPQHEQGEDIGSSKYLLISWYL